ncbi:hypothetical protein B0I35DRAFT_482510 [Stachybotrys elegans]|uniref:Rhodopsin domain-containing protein n=1 Tax=Stachybotrys elegans TaxID=80388 RepID=A0A8K0WNS6_9HYPO|nr:hypothetical protein B0I35DRAFT_482510 [Stachybotrys elegans]
MSAGLDIDALSEEQRAAFLASPVGPPPPGYEQDLINPHHRPDIAIGVTITCLALTTVSFAIRGYSQYVVSRVVSTENFLGLVAFGAYCGLISVFFRLAELRVFWNHHWNMSQQDMSDVLFELYLLPIFYCLVTGFVKSAILLEWKRIFVPRGIRNRFWWTCIILVTISILFYNAFLIALQFLCEPHERIWRRWVGGTCRNRQDMDLPSAIFNLVLDLIILALPQKIIWNLQMTKARRFGISFVFSVGLLALVCAIGLVYAVSTMDYLHDVIYDQGPANLWLLCESTCAMLVFCVPTFPKAFEGTWVVTHFVGPMSQFPLSVIRGTKPKMGKRERYSETTGENNSDRRWHGNPISRALWGSASRLSSPSMTDIERFSHENDANSQVRLADLEPPARSLGRNGILRTTEIKTEVSDNATHELVRDKSNGLLGRREHTRPWDGTQDSD